MIVSIAMDVLPVLRSPITNSRWPRPIGTNASMAFKPVCIGSDTDLNFDPTNPLEQTPDRISQPYIPNFGDDFTPKENVPADMILTPGMQLTLSNQMGQPVPVVVVEVTDTIVYQTNFYTRTQYKWNGVDWSKSFEGEYKRGQWRIAL